MVTPFSFRSTQGEEERERKEDARQPWAGLMQSLRDGDHSMVGFPWHDHQAGELTGFWMTSHILSNILNAFSAIYMVRSQPYGK